MRRLESWQRHQYLKLLLLLGPAAAAAVDSPAQRWTPLHPLQQYIGQNGTDVFEILIAPLPLHCVP